MTGRVAAVTPCAGFSSRMKDFKPLMPLGRGTVLSCVIHTLQSAGVADILVVAGHRADEVVPQAQSLGAACVVNKGFARGMFSSVRTGLDALPGDVGRVLVLPVDIPLVRPKTIRQLLHYAGPAAVVYPTFLGERGHPPLIAAGLVPKVLAWGGSDGLRGALAALEADHGAFDMPVADANVLFDLDTPQDYQEALGRHSRLGWPSPQETAALADMHGPGSV